LKLGYARQLVPEMNATLVCYSAERVHAIMLEQARAQHLMWEDFHDKVRTFIWDNIDYLPSVAHRTVLDNMELLPGYIYGIMIVIAFITLESLFCGAPRHVTLPPKPVELELKEELAQISGAIATLERHRTGLQQQLVALKAKQG
jgi:hypothetical protein